MSETKPLTWRESLANAAIAAKNKVKSAASSASASARRGMAASTDKSSGEINRNINKCKLAANIICSDGKLPVAGGELFTTENTKIGDVEVIIHTATPLGTSEGMVYDEQNYQAVRRSLPSKGVKPSINDTSKMEQYEKDIVVLQPWSDKRKPITPKEAVAAEAEAVAAAAGGGFFSSMTDGVKNSVSNIKGKFGSSTEAPAVSEGGTRRVGRKSKRGRKSRKASKSRKSRKSSKSRKVRKARRGSKSRKSRRC
mgnify:CR=1 FL=1|uniref:Uncharacterized protein n=1 Tax=viral metagenome TaxID=1070528 RepID=A0A6C0LWJ3_9ZZZZ